MDATRELVLLAREYLDGLARRHPDVATELGDHRYDATLRDLTQDALDDERRVLGTFSKRVAALDVAALTPEQRVDAAMLTGHVELRAFELAELREHEWNPLLANPGRAMYTLLARDFAPLPDRLAVVAGRLSQVPWLLAAARSHLGAMPRVHLETAVGQFDGTIKLVSEVIDESLQDASPAAIADIGRVRPAALEALAEHPDWLSARLADRSGDGAGHADTRTGPEMFSRKLSLTLQPHADADPIVR